jgi:hypothetical protein
VRIFHNLILYLLIWWMQRRGKYFFKIWIDLEAQKEKILKSVQEQTDFPEQLLAYLFLSTGIHWKWYQMGDWTLLARLFYVCISKSPKVELPLITPSGEKPKNDEPWDYESRTWHLYSHLLAKSYGWDLEYIGNLSVIEALAKIQEIIVEDQLDKEFIYGLSEVAYHYDKNTKTSRFVPMPRPHWMRAQPKPIQRFLIPVSMMPMGNVIMDNVLPDEYMPREVY